VLRGDTLRVVFGGPEVGWAAALMAGIGLFYLGLLLLPQMKMEVSLVAQRRWFDSSLPSDNTLPQLLAEKVAAGEPLRPVLFLDWQSSDRPPLEAGWQLLARAPLRLLLGSDANATDMRNQIAGMILQLSWVPALWGFLRALGLSRQWSGRLIVSLAPSGFLLLNSMFVWPKLNAAAFTLGAFTLFFQLRPSHPLLGRVIAGAGLAALAYLSHGGTMFALLVFGIVLLIPHYFFGWKYALGGAAVFLLLNIPWLTFQKFYDPPGNRLIKWHIGGSTVIDSRGVIETMIASYGEVGVKGALDRKKTNLATLFGGSFKSLVNLNGGKAATGRRLDEFFFIFRSLGWWNLGWLVGLVVIWRRRRNIWNRPDAQQLLLACGVLGLTLTIWALLMFGPSTTVIHQGSYFANLLLFAVLAVILMRTSARLWAAVAIMNAAAFFATYLPRTAAAKAHLDWMAVGLTVAAAVGLLAIALRRLQADASLAGLADPSPRQRAH
jgi:hypothetical protein